MQKEIFNSINEFGQTAYDAAMKMGELNLRASEKLMEQQFALTGAMLETSTKSLELMSQAKTPQEILNGQAKLVQDYGQTWLNACRGTVDILAEARDAAGDLIDENVKAANEKVKKAATAKAA